MKDLIKQNYESIVARGLITPCTNFHDFMNKHYEEYNELEYAYMFNGLDSNEVKEELADCILVLLNMAHHYDIDIEKELWKKIEINKKRCR
jgi:NTP pyrophosphatase (non-canonical NTP hydrolase)